MKKLIALVLSLVMALSLSVVAWGATMTESDLQNLLNADGTVTLTGNVTVENGLSVPAGVTVTLDLAGYTISQTKAQTAGYQMLENKGNLTITDSVGGGKMTYTDSGNGGEYISDTIYNRGTLVINGGTIENLSSATVASNGYPHAVDTYSGDRDTSVTINGGTIYCANYSAIRMFCVSATNKADLVINGGTIKGAIDMQNGTAAAALGSLTINDGTFETTANANNIRFANWNGGATTYGITASIDGGSFDGGITSAYVPAAANWDSKIITGGTFTDDVSAYMADGLSLVGGEVVKNTGTTYENLNGKYANGTVVSNNLDLLLNVIPAKAPTYDDDGVLVAPGKVESAIIKKGNAQVAGTGVYVLVNSLGDLTNPADIVLYKDAEMKYPAYFLKAINTPEYAVGLVFSNFGKLCGQVNYPDYKATDVYFTAQGEDTGAIFVADKNGTINVMYGGKLVAVEPIGYSAKADAVPHKAMMINKNGKTTSIECTVCGLDAVQVANKLALPVGATQIAGTLSGVWYWPSTPVVTPSTDKVQSAETFDAGIAMYVGMSVMAAAGSAVVLKKKD